MQREKTRYLFSFVSPVKIAAIPMGIHSYFTSMTGKNCTVQPAFQNQTPHLLYCLEATNIHEETQAGTGTHGFLNSQVPATFLFIHQVFLTRGERKALNQLFPF